MPYAEKVMQQCEELAAISSMPNGVCRTYLTPEHSACNHVVRRWIEQAGMESWQDQAGNICGRYSSANPQAKILVLGSHLDSIPNAGKYDGILGVLIAIEVVRQFSKAKQRFPFHIDVVGFGDEEGSRFGTTLLGSRAFSGTWLTEWFALVDKQGITLANALKEFGSDPEKIATASRAEDNLLAYLEIHIEQGPVLEELNQPLGVVPSIAGARRFIVKIKGKAGHAGTVPMNMRQDALVAAASAIHMVEQIANRFQIVATVGQLQCYPGATNVIPGDCHFSIDIRSGRDQTRDLAVKTIQDELNCLIAERKMQIEWEQIHSAPAVECASWIQRLMESVIQDMKLEPVSIVSGAGHDAMSVAEISEVGMMFIRCAGGVSHNPAESVDTVDVAAAIEAFERTILKISSEYSSINTDAVGESEN